VPRLLACAVVLAALLVAPASAGAKGPVKGCVKTAERGTVQRFECTTQAITVSGYEVKQNGVSAEWLGVPKPTIDGHITAMDVDVVDASGRPIPINRLMLHHIVFANLGARLGTKFDGTCSTFSALDNRSTIPRWPSASTAPARSARSSTCRPATAIPTRAPTSGS